MPECHERAKSTERLSAIAGRSRSWNPARIAASTLASKACSADVELGLRDEQRGSILQHATQLLKQPLEVRDLVNHPESNGKPESPLCAKPQIVSAGLDELSARREPTALESLLGHLQHARLEIDGGNQPVRTD